MSNPGTAERGPIVDGAEAFAVGAWRVEPALHLISNEAQSQHLEPRVMDLLVYLAAARGRVVARGELLDAVWGDVVVNEEAVSRAVSELRKALGDDPKAPRYVQTIRKSGYRLVAEVSATPPGAVRASRPAHRAWIGRRWLGGALGLLMVAVVLGWWLVRERAPAAPAPATPLVAQLLTTYPGREIDPAIDRPGQRVVFAWNGAEDGDYDLYVRRFGPAEKLLRLTHTPGFEGHPAWSPDGAAVAFVREGEAGAAVWTVSGLGGDERRLFALAGWSFGLDWFPDGRSVVVSQPGDDGVQRLVRLYLDASGAQLLTAPDQRLAGDYKPAVSPDGAWVAFVRGGRLDQQDVYVVRVADGQERRLSRTGGRIRGVDWSPDGHSVLYASDVGGGFGLWRAAIDGSQAAWLPLNGQDIYNPVVAASGRLVFESISFEENLWSLDLTAGPHASPERLALRSTRQETLPAFSPDGRELAFVSNRSGQRTLWLGSFDSANSRPLTRPDEAVAGGPVWSPGGSRIAVALVVDGFARPFVVMVGSGRSRPLLDEPTHAIPVAWSGDGARIYLASDRGGQWDLWSIGVDGDALTQMTTSGGLAAAETEDGAWLYYTRSGDPAFYALALADVGGGGSEVGRQVGRVEPAHGRPWRLAAGAIYTVALEGEAFILLRLDPASGEVEEVARPPGLYNSAFALSDSGQLIYSRVEESESDLMFLDVSLDGTL